MDALLVGLKNCKNEEDLEQLADLYKSINKVVCGGPSQEAIDWFEVNKDKMVNIKNTDMEGRVKKLNTSTRGFYPGDRYPIYVEITKDDRTDEYNAVGNTFEYDLEQLVLLEGQ